jgi:excisionase family DNA binding protein
MNDHLNENHDGVATLDLLTVPEAAKLLRISRNLAYELVARQELPAVRLGRVIRIPRYSLDEWIASQASQHVVPGTLSSPHG